MDIIKAITILESLAAGCSPATGIVVSDESVLNERDVIRALQVAIDYLRGKTNILERSAEVEIDEEDIQTVLQLFREQNSSVTSSRLTGFFLATRSFKNDQYTGHRLYGKYKDLFRKGQLRDFFDIYLGDSAGARQEKKRRDKQPWEDIGFFQTETFNNLSAEATDRLKEKINELGITRTTNISDYVQKARINYPRSYEPWTDEERRLLWEALQDTNDLNLLSSCFQRGPNTIEHRGQELIYQNQNPR